MMRFGWLAAGAAMVTAGQAGAVNLLLQPNVSPTITSGQTQTCTTTFPQTCTSTAPQFSRRLSDISIDVPFLDGTFSFGPAQQGPNSNAGVYEYSGSITFDRGNLVSDIITFTYRSAQVGSSSITDTFATGFLRNVQVFIPSTGQTLQPVPEPTTWAMMVLGFAVLGFAIRRRQTISFGSVSRA